MNLVALTRVLLALSFLATSNALAQTAFLRSAVIPGTASGSGVCVSPSGDWIFGASAFSGGVPGPTFVWNVATSQVTPLPSVPGAQYLVPAHINEKLSLIVANTSLGIHLFDGASFVNVSGIAPPGFSNLAVVGATEDARLMGFNGATPRTTQASIAFFRGQFLDLGAVVSRKLGIRFVTDQVTDVATGRPVVVGYGTDASNRDHAYMFDFSTGVCVRLGSPLARKLYPLAVSHDGLSVTGVALNPQNVEEAFLWSRRTDPLMGPHTQPLQLLGFLDFSNPRSWGTAIDANGRVVIGMSTGLGGQPDAFIWYTPNLITAPAVYLNGIHDMYLRLTTVLSANPGPLTGLVGFPEMSPRGIVTGTAISSANPFGDAYAARLPYLGCRTDLAPPFGWTDVADVLQFLADANAGEIQADYDFDGVVTQADAIAFTNDWNAGCH